MLELHPSRPNRAPLASESGGEMATSLGMLFVGKMRLVRADVTAPYTFLGPCRFVGHRGARPMAIKWELDRDMPAWLFQEVKVAAG